jgi:hypothetical protein
MTTPNPAGVPPLDRRPVKPVGMIFSEARTRWVRTGDAFRVVSRPAIWPMSLLFVAFGAMIVFLLISQVGSMLLPRGSVEQVVGLIFVVLLFVVLGCGFILMGLSSFLDRVWFDRSLDRGRRFALLGPRWTVAVSDVVAVQCLFAGWWGKERLPHYQLNVALRDGTRVAVCDEPDETLIRTTGDELADFLKVPLADDIAVTRHP